MRDEGGPSSAAADGSSAAAEDGPAPLSMKRGGGCGVTGTDSDQSQVMSSSVSACVGRNVEPEPTPWLDDRINQNSIKKL